MGLNTNGALAPRWLKISTASVFVLWIVAQVVMLVLYWQVPQYSDAANYAAFARQAFDAGSWYPLAANIANDMWVANTGYINFLVANLYLFGTLDFVGIEQLLLNILLLWSLAKLTRYFAGDAAACMAVLVFCLLPSNTVIVAAHMSDLLAVALILFSMAMLRRSWPWLIAAGFVVILANWVRPVAMVYLPSLLLFALYKHVKFKWYVPYICGMAIGAVAIAGLTYASCGHAMLGSTTKGTNMIMGCNDRANGAYDASVFEEGGPGYIDPALGYNAFQTDSALTRRSAEWILSHPGRFAALAPAKMFRLWGADYYVDKILEEDSHTSGKTQMMLSATYYLAILLCLVGLWRERKSLWGIAGILFMPVLIGSAMHLLMYGGMRYHYPMLPPVIYFAAVGLCALLKMPPKSIATGR